MECNTALKLRDFTNHVWEASDLFAQQLVNTIASIEQEARLVCLEARSPASNDWASKWKPKDSTGGNGYGNGNRGYGNRDGDNGGQGNRRQSTGSYNAGGGKTKDIHEGPHFIKDFVDGSKANGGNDYSQIICRNYNAPQGCSWHIAKGTFCCYRHVLQEERDQKKAKIASTGDNPFEK